MDGKIENELSYGNSKRKWVCGTIPICKHVYIIMDMVSKFDKSKKQPELAEATVRKKVDDQKRSGVKLC